MPVMVEPRTALAPGTSWSAPVRTVVTAAETSGAEWPIQSAHDPIVNAQTGEDDGVSLREEGLADLDGTPLEAVGTDGGEHVRAFRGLHDGGSGDRQDFARLAWQLEPP